MEDISLKDKHVLVTGGSRGIGRAIVLAFARAGSSVSFIYNKSDEAASEIVSLGQKNGYSIAAFKYDLSDLSHFEALINRIKSKRGAINILVNNAGIKIRTEFLTATLDQWDKNMSVNLRAVYFISQAVAKEMILVGSGKIINIASQSGVCHVERSIEYGIAKAGIIYMTLSLAKVLASSKITVNAVSPGRTYTDLTEYSNDKVKEAATIEGIPLKKINSPENIADSVLFFAGSRADNITGQILAIDGGEGIR